MVMLNYGTNIEEYVKETYAPEIGYSIIVSSNYETVPANNNAVVEYYYEANLWTLYYSTNKDLNGSKVVAYNSLILPELPNTELEGYNFSGWFNGENTVTETDRMPNNDLTDNGNYVIKTFEVSVIDEDNEILSDVYEYGTKLSVITSNETVKEYLHGLEENGYVGKLNINGEELNETNVITSDLIITISKVEKEYTLIFMNGEDVISSALVKFNTTITYPVMSGYVENGVEYIFTWDDKSYDGKPMPAMDLVIKGNYKEKASAAIYFGSFKQSKSAYTPDSTTKYCDFSMLESEHYNKVNTSDYIGEGNVIQVTIIADPELQGLTAVQRNKYLKSWTQPLAILIPREIVENYSIELIDAINFNIWVNFTSDKEVVSYDGNEYYFFVNYNEETLNPVVATESMSFTLKLTKK
jgi:hypothetical protein